MRRGEGRAALEALPDLARRGGATRPIRVASADDVERELIAARKIGVRFIALGEPDYPPVLRQMKFGAANSRPQRARGGAAEGGGSDRRAPATPPRRGSLSPNGVARSFGQAGILSSFPG